MRALIVRVSPTAACGADWSGPPVLISAAALTPRVAAAWAAGGLPLPRA